MFNFSKILILILFIGIYRDDRRRIELVVRHFIPDFFCFPRTTIVEDEAVDEEEESVEEVEEENETEEVEESMHHSIFQFLDNVLILILIMLISFFL